MSDALELVAEIAALGEAFCKGALGIWRVPPDVEAEVRRRIVA